MFDAAIAGAAARYGVPEALIRGIITVESGWRLDAYNPNDPGGAWGLMQMIPTTARNLGYLGPMDALLSDADLAIDLGTKLLQENLRIGGSIPAAISAYNMGYGGQLPDGTFVNQAYVDKVLVAMGGRGTGLGGAALLAAGFRPGADHPETAGLTDAPER